mmetsp:Transcript_52742/g.153728  ORF Transcript_52742/g.153728 Transcript_52742/m.153728 type:complete len:250 (-) Transcript_52742:93-842(-)
MASALLGGPPSPLLQGKQVQEARSPADPLLAEVAVRPLCASPSPRRTKSTPCPPAFQARRGMWRDPRCHSGPLRSVPTGTPRIWRSRELQATRTSSAGCPPSGRMPMPLTWTRRSRGGRKGEMLEPHRWGCGRRLVASMMVQLVASMAPLALCTIKVRRRQTGGSRRKRTMPCRLHRRSPGNSPMGTCDPDWMTPRACRTPRARPTPAQTVARVPQARFGCDSPSPPSLLGAAGCGRRRPQLSSRTPLR